MLGSQLVAIESAFGEHRLPLERRLTLLTRDPEAAQDLAQEAFLRLAREVAADRAPDDIAAWLHRVGSNLVMSRGRHLQVVDRRAGELPRPAEPPTPEHEVLRGELHSAVRRLMARLTTTERDALLLAAEGYRGTEIAASLGRTPGATRTLLCRTRAKLREQLVQLGYSPA